MFGVRDVLTAWELDPVPTVGIVVTGLGYAAASARVRRSGRAWPAHRDVLFGSGLLVLLIALDGPPDVFADSSFALHMAQHLLIQLIAAPLLLLAAPVTLALRASPPRLRRRALVPVLRSPILHAISRPAVAFGLFAVVLVGSHLSPIYGVALRDDTVHAIEHIAYLATALLFWWPAIGVDPGPAQPEHLGRLFYVLLIMPVMAFLGIAITSAGHVLYPYYVSHPPPWGSSPLQDQHLAGTLMWTSGMLTIPPLLVVVLLRWLDQDDKHEARRAAGIAKAARAGGH